MEPTKQIMKPFLRFSLFRSIGVLAFVFQTFLTFGQNCDSITPSFNVDLSASPNQTWTSPMVLRDGNCCGTSNPDKCLEFIITLNPSAIAINFVISAGAVPSGALFYQINCGPITPVGSPICLSGPGPHNLTFCKPGNNANAFSIVSYSEPIIGPDISLNNGCSGSMYANYYNEPTITWTSIFPGVQGTYNSLLNCISGCDTVLVTAPLNPPAFVDYLVCGMDAGGCNPFPICDTIRVTFITPPSVTVSPNSQHLCFGAQNITLSATVSGGTPPYSFLWNTGETGSSILAGAGVFIVNIVDSFACLVVSDTALITQDLLPINASAGTDQFYCALAAENIPLNGIVQIASGGIWTGGTGIFLPNNTTLNALYSPSAEEISIGFLDLILTSTGNNGCPAQNDTVRLNFEYFTESFLLQTTNVSCFGHSDGAASISTSGIFNPYSFSLNGGTVTTNTIFVNLAAGNHTLVLINILGCDTTINFSITQPNALIAAVIDQQNNSCFGEENGEADVQASGGTAPYSFNWNTIPPNSSHLATNLAASTYICSINDANGCSIEVSAAITEPSPISLSLAAVSPSCFGLSNGAISATVDGGIAPYFYDWSSGLTSSNLYNLSSGWYVLNLTDANNCALSDSIFLVQPPQLTGTISPNTVICPITPTELTVTVSGGTGNYQFLWNPSTQTNQTIMVSPANNQMYSCAISDNNGCSINLSTSVFVTTISSADLQANISATSICITDSVLLWADYLGNDPTVALSWLNCPNCDATSPMYETPFQNTNYILAGTNSCGSVIYDTVSVILNPLPIVELIPVMGEICPGEFVTFTATGVNSSSWDYLWDFGDGQTSNSMQPNHQYNTSGTFLISVTVTDLNGCVTNMVEESQVIVNPRASAEFSSSSLSESTLDPTFYFYNSSSDASEFTWYFGDGFSSALENPNHTYENFGAFIVQLIATNSYNCPDSTTIQIEIEPSYNVYVPNSFSPEGDKHNPTFYAQGYGILDKDFSLLIFDRWGEIVFESHDITDVWDGRTKKGEQAQDGTYTWVIYFRDLTEQKYRKEGHVSIIK
jgi:gliding motility-associated-like protein